MQEPSSSRCGGHACDCTRAPVAAPAPFVELWAQRPHVREMLARLSGEQGAGLRLAGPDWAERLDGLVAALTPAEAAEVQVVVPAPEPGAPPAVLPVQDALLRARTPWLPELLGRPEALYPHFQPIVSLRTGEVAGYEALIRGRHEGRELSGGEIVSAARAHGQLYALDLRGRTAALEHGLPQLEDDRRLFVNFSPGAIYDPDICLRTTFAVARRLGSSLDRIVFEVVESEQYPDLGFLRRILDRYRAEGARVALDDLGAGYASLNHLRILRPDVVKLDRELLHGIATDDARRRLVAALVDYAHDLGIEVIAEGIENGDDLRTAAELGADMAQGWHLGRPAAEMRPSRLSEAPFEVSLRTPARAPA